MGRENKLVYDLVIIGGGPAGISAAIYAQQAALNAVMFEKNTIGGKLNEKKDVKNYAGFKSIAGSSLAKLMKEQLLSFAFEIKKQCVESLTKSDEIFFVKTEKEEFITKSVIVATGTVEKKLGIVGEEKFTNLCTFHSVTSNCFLPRNEVVVVGGGYSACEAADYLSKFAKSVYLIYHDKELRVDFQLKNLIEKNQKIKVFPDSEVIQIKGKKQVDSVVILVSKRIEKEVKVSAVFSYVGWVANSLLVSDFNVCDITNYVQVDENCCTKIPGLFSAGDVSKKRDRQIVTAIADGAVAAQSAIYYLSNGKKK